VFGASGDVAVDAVQGYIEDLNDMSFVQKGMESVGGAFSIIMFSIAISVVCSYLLVFMFKYLVRPLVVTMMVLGFFACFVLMCVLWEKYFFYKDLLNELENSDQALDSDIRNRNFFLWAGAAPAPRHHPPPTHLPTLPQLLSLGR
jgi:glucan phosphoethanolaminetransferase (alkaline phosphatase superfamily)